MAEALLSLFGEETKTSTSSFRSPGGPTPSRGLFFGGERPLTRRPPLPLIGSLHMRVLAGDIGGTKTHLALFDVDSKDVEATTVNGEVKTGRTEARLELLAIRRVKLKIDREFVSHVDARPGSRAICKALIELAAGLELTVLAEGVERDRAVALWCGSTEVFLKPGPTHETRSPTWLRSSSRLTTSASASRSASARSRSGGAAGRAAGTGK